MAGTLKSLLARLTHLLVLSHVMHSSHGHSGMVVLDEVVVPLWRDLRRLQSFKWTEFGILDTDLDQLTAEVNTRQAGK